MVRVEPKIPTLIMDLGCSLSSPGHLLVVALPCTLPAKAYLVVGNIHPLSGCKWYFLCLDRSIPSLLEAYDCHLLIADPDLSSD